MRIFIVGVILVLIALGGWMIVKSVDVKPSDPVVDLSQMVQNNLGKTDSVPTPKVDLLLILLSND